MAAGEDDVLLTNKATLLKLTLAADHYATISPSIARFFMLVSNLLIMYFI